MRARVVGELIHDLYWYRCLDGDAVGSQHLLVMQGLMSFLDDGPKPGDPGDIPWPNLLARALPARCWMRIPKSLRERTLQDDDTIRKCLTAILAQSPPLLESNVGKVPHPTYWIGPRCLGWRCIAAPADVDPRCVNGLSKVRLGQAAGNLMRNEVGLKPGFAWSVGTRGKPNGVQYLGGLHKVLAAALLCISSPYGSVEITVKDLARHTGLSPNSVQGKAADLLAAGVLIAIEEGRAWRSSVYHLHLDRFPHLTGRRRDVPTASPRHFRAPGSQGGDEYDDPQEALRRLEEGQQRSEDDLPEDPLIHGDQKAIRM